MAVMALVLAVQQAVAVVAFVCKIDMLAFWTASTFCIAVMALLLAVMALVLAVQQIVAAVAFACKLEILLF